MSAKPTVMVVASYYLPGYRAGGPIRSVSAIVDRLSDEFRFRVVTGDRDAGAAAPYEGVETGCWETVGDAEVRYLSRSEQTLSGLAEVLNQAPYDLLYVNTFLHPVYALRVLGLHRMGWIPETPVLVAPRGHLSPGALSVKAWRKKAYLALVRALGLCEGVVFHASNEQEQQDIRRVFPDARVRVASDLLPPLGEDPSFDEREPVKESGHLRAVFLSRVAPEKNLRGLLEACRKVDARVELSIVGPVDDESYWSECEDLIVSLPDNVACEYLGAVTPRRVPEVLRDHHLFVLPTLSENFGHAILEALSVGLPALVSDQTPWSGLEEHGAGWVCLVDAVDCFTARIEKAADLAQEEYSRMSAAARSYVEKAADQESAERANRRMFRDLVRSGLQGSSMDPPR